MHTTLTSAQEGPASELSIGDLAEATGVAVGTLRMWESRHDFPRPQRRASGHRRYSEADVAAVREVQRLREAGSVLAAAIARVAAEPAAPGSVYAEVVRAHPHLRTQRLRKSTLLGLSWAIEDQILAGSERGLLFGAFQKAENFESARTRWTELARRSAGTFVFADFDGSPAQPAERSVYLDTHLVDLPEDSPMHREWTVVYDSGSASMALTAWEVPGQHRVPDADRLFESVWTCEPAAVRTAARTAAAVAAEHGDSGAEAVLHGVLAEPAPAQDSASIATAITHRALAYVEDVGRHHQPGWR